MIIRDFQGFVFAGYSECLTGSLLVCGVVCWASPELEVGIVALATYFYASLVVAIIFGAWATSVYTF